MQASKALAGCHIQQIPFDTEAARTQIQGIFKPCFKAQKDLFAPHLCKVDQKFSTIVTLISFKHQCTLAMSDWQELLMVSIIHFWSVQVFPNFCKGLKNIIPFGTSHVGNPPEETAGRQAGLALSWDWALLGFRDWKTCEKCTQWGPQCVLCAKRTTTIKNLWRHNTNDFMPLFYSRWNFILTTPFQLKLGLFFRRMQAT